jgi:hypothetical protein
MSHLCALCASVAKNPPICGQKIWGVPWVNPGESKRIQPNPGKSRMKNLVRTSLSPCLCGSSGSHRSQKIRVNSCPLADQNLVKTPMNPAESKLIGANKGPPFESRTGWSGWRLRSAGELNCRKSVFHWQAELRPRICGYKRVRAGRAGVVIFCYNWSQHALLYWPRSSKPG